MQHLFEHGDHTYSFVDIPALKAARILIHMQKYFKPVVSGGANIDVAELLGVLDEDVIDCVIIPLFAASQLTRVEKTNRKMDSAAMLEVCFPTAADLADLVVLTKHVFEVQFGDFMTRLSTLFTEDFPAVETPLKRKVAK